MKRLSMQAAMSATLKAGLLLSLGASLFAAPATAATTGGEPTEWKPGTAYAAGGTVAYQGNWYESAQAHQSAVGWEPSQASTLWKKVDPLSRIQTGGRVQKDASGFAYSWTGVYFNARFQGTGIGIKFDDAFNRYNIEIDGTAYPIVVAPGKTVHWIRGLASGEHTIRLSKASELPWATGRFEGFVPDEGGALLQAPAAPSRQIEFIGDSWTAGYGSLSNKRECTYEEVVETSDADKTFGAFTAKHYGADYQINALSGRGMVRNYSGTEPGISYRTFYDRALTAAEGNTWDWSGWKPQAVVIGLGINDFSTSIQPGEAYTPESLKAAYKTAYHDFIAKLRSRYGANTDIIVSATPLWPDYLLQQYTQEIVNEERAQGDTRVHYFLYQGVELNACQWHPSVADHHVIENQLVRFIDALPQAWNGISAATSVWGEERNYRVNDLVTYQGAVYRCIQAHRALADWTPSAAASLWQKQG